MILRGFFLPVASALLLTALPPSVSRGQSVDKDSLLTEKAFVQLSDRSVSRLGERALQIREKEWKHAETANFVYHYFDSFIAAPVASEAEFYYRVIAKELGKDTTHWERKCHIFIFESDADWAQFQQAGGLEPWTGGIHVRGELFIQRNPQRKFKGNALAHETTHLVIDRFFGSGVPLWLNEGLAEYAASRWYAAYYRARGYNAKPYSQSVAPEDYVPVSSLASLASYPMETKAVYAFYSESERLVRFLCAADKTGFVSFLEAMSKGSRFETALDKGFARKFFNTEALEKEFKPYASKDHVPDPQN